MFMWCACVHVRHACVPCFCIMPGKPEDSVGSLETSVTEKPVSFPVGDRNQTQMLCKTGKYC